MARIYVPELQWTLTSTSQRGPSVVSSRRTSEKLNEWIVIGRGGMSTSWPSRTSSWARRPLILMEDTEVGRCMISPWKSAKISLSRGHCLDGERVDLCWVRGLQHLTLDVVGDGASTEGHRCL